MSGGLNSSLPIGATPAMQAAWLKQQQAMLIHQQMLAMQHAQNLMGGSAVWTGNQSTFNTTASVFQGPATPPQPQWLKPDPKQPDTLGWREWVWSDADQRLKSPSQGTLWPEAELVVPHWDDGEAVRGVSGVHAHLVPKHWKILAAQHTEYARGPDRVHGIVERFGKFVLGTEGWRAEWAIIRELMAPSTEVGLMLEQAYPDVIIHYPDDEEDQSCTSVKSSKSGKGSRPTPRPRPSQSAIPDKRNPYSQPSSPVSQQSTLTPGSPAWRAQNGLPPLKNQSDVNSSPPTSTSQSGSSSSTRRAVNRFIYKWFWVLFGLVFYALTFLANWVLS